MNETSDALFHGLVCLAAVWLALLWLAQRLGCNRRRGAVRLVAGAGAAFLLITPVAGAPLWNWAFSFCPNPSLPLLAIIGIALCTRLWPIRVWSAADWRAMWVFGAAAGCVLYLHPFFYETPDLYYWGWNEPVAAWVIAGLAVLLLGWGNRLGLIFIAALVAFEFELLESHNGWDYVVDPFYWIASCAVLLKLSGQAWLERRALGQPGRLEARAGIVHAASPPAGSGK